MSRIQNTRKTPVFISSILIACISTSMAVGTVYLTQSIFADIGEVFSVPVEHARLSFTIVSIAYALSFFLLGPLSDFFEARKMAAAGLLMTAVALATAAFSPAFSFFLSTMLFIGLAAAATPAAMFSLMPRIAPKDQIGTYFGLIIMASVIGITLGRTGTGLFTSWFSLKKALLINAGILSFLGVVMAGLPVFNAGEDRQNRPQTISLAYTNALMLLKDPCIITLFITGFLLFFAYLGAVTFLTFYLLQPPFSFNSADIGTVSLVGLSAILGAPVSGRLVGKFGPIAVALCGFAIVILAIVILRLATDTFLVTTGLFLIFLGVFSCQPAIFVLIANRVENDRRGAASSAYLLVCLTGGSLSSALLGPVWTEYNWMGVSNTCILLAVLGAVTLLVGRLLSRKQRAALSP